jgi:mannosylglycoprotein endo-beta-mannosidase
MLLLNKVELPEDSNEVFFLRLQLIDGDVVLDENLYWLSNKPRSYEKLNDLRKVTVKTVINKNDAGHAEIQISNPDNETAFFIRVKVMNTKNELVLPSFLTDNYFTLLPGDIKQVGLDISERNSQGNLEELHLEIEGWNVLPVEIKL